MRAFQVLLLLTSMLSWGGGTMCVIVQVMLRLLSKPIFKSSEARFCPCHCAHIPIVGLKWPS